MLFLELISDVIPSFTFIVQLSILVRHTGSDFQAICYVSNQDPYPVFHNRRGGVSRNIRHGEKVPRGRAEVVEGLELEKPRLVHPAAGEVAAKGYRRAKTWLLLENSAQSECCCGRLILSVSLVIRRPKKKER